MSCLIGLDIGTTGVKAIMINRDGKVLATDFQEYPLYFPRPGWAEQNPEDWWNATIKSIKNLMGKARVKPDSIKGLSFSGQMHGLICLDKNYKVIRPAILWCDVRTTPQCKKITEIVGKEKLLKLVSNPALEGFTLPKLIWVRDNELQNYVKIKKILLPKDYIRFKMTGKIGIDISDAAGTLMLNVVKRKWSDELLKILKIDKGILPDVYESIDVAGEITDEVAKLTGLAIGTKIVFGGADNTCSAVGNGIIKVGLVSSSIGSSGVVLAPAEKVKLEKEGRIHTFNHSVPNLWYFMGVMLSAGISYRWFRDTFGEIEKEIEKKRGIDAYNSLNKLAEKVPVGSEGLIFLPYLNGERTPHQDGYAKGVFFGITPRHTKGHFVRAILEGVVYGLRDSLEIIKEMSVPIKQIRLTGGGAKSLLWRQIQADIFNHPVVTINVDEGPAFGAAIIAGVGVGVYKSFSEATDNIIKVSNQIEPIKKNVKIYDEFYQIYKSLYPELKGSFCEVSKLLK